MNSDRNLVWGVCPGLTWESTLSTICILDDISPVCCVQLSHVSVCESGWDKIILSSLPRLMCNLQSALVIVQVDVCEFVETSENGMWEILRVHSDCPQTQFCGVFSYRLFSECTMLRHEAYSQPTCQSFVHSALQCLQLQPLVRCRHSLVHIVCEDNSWPTPVV